MTIEAHHLHHFGLEIKEAETLRDNGQLVEAKGNFDAVIRKILRVQPNNSAILGFAYQQRGVNARLLDDRAAARKDFQDAHRSFGDVDDTVGQAHVLRDLGILTYEDGSISTAENLLRQSLAGFQGMRLENARGITRIKLGNVIASTDSRTSEAESAFEEGLTELVRSGDTSLLLIGSLDVVKFYVKKGDFRLARNNLAVAYRAASILPSEVHKRKKAEVADFVSQLLEPTIKRLIPSTD